MIIISSGDVIYHYAKRRNVTIQISNCPRCNSEAKIYSECDSGCGESYAYCPYCNLRGWSYYTDTGYSYDLSMEQATNHWNERDDIFFETNNPEKIYVYNSLSKCLQIE